MLFAALAAAASIMMAPGTTREVTIQTLLPEMTDLAGLARRSNPVYKEAQASSYDRATVAPDKPGWFANGDAGQFVRVEDKGTRKEYVLADLSGPGAVVRFWSANPAGTVRFYFDGAALPTIECPLSDLLGGKIAPMVDPFSYVASSGWNLYYPIPYAKSLKITVDDPGRAIYYHVGFRTYQPGTKVETFTQAQLAASASLAERIGRGLLGKEQTTLPRGSQVLAIKKLAVPAGAARVVRSLKAAKGGSAIYTLVAHLDNGVPEDRSSLAKWTDPRAVNNLLRNVILQIEFDGQASVEAPLGDFFGSAPGLNTFRTLPFQVDRGGSMVCSFVMPFARSARIKLLNVGKAEAKVSMNLVTGPFAFDSNTYHFHAQWTVERSKTRPFHDMHFLNVRGEGRWLGSNLHIANTTTAWWGEGDEKVYVDGDTFPSTIGTGTEDYYGYAWGSAALFQRPYHAQTRVDGPGLYGHTSVSRYHVFDNIPYSTALRFDLELWHWSDTTVNVARTAYWYAKPGGTPPVAVDRSLLAPPYLPSSQTVPGAIEGESLKFTKTGGRTEVQSGFFEASKGAHLWWREAKVGDKLTFVVPVASQGTYEVVGNFAFAGDYGIHRLHIVGQDGDEAKETHDFYSGNLRWQTISLGVFTLAKGQFELEVECRGKNAAAAPGNMFALDYVFLKRK